MEGWSSRPFGKQVLASKSGASLEVTKRRRRHGGQSGRGQRVAPMSRLQMARRAAIDTFSHREAPTPQRCIYRTRASRRSPCAGPRLDGPIGKFGRARIALTLQGTCDPAGIHAEVLDSNEDLARVDQAPAGRGGAVRVGTHQDPPPDRCRVDGVLVGVQAHVVVPRQHQAADQPVAFHGVLGAKLVISQTR